MMDYFIGILEITLPVSVLILLLTIMSPLLKREFIAKWSYYMWLFIAIRISLPIKLVTEQTAIKITTPAPQNISGAALVQTSSAITWQEIIMLLYFTGVVIFLLFKLICYCSFILKTKRWQSGCDARIADCIDNLCRELKIKQIIPAFTCKNISTPMLVGMFRPKLLLPNKSFTDTQLEFIITHELMHLCHHDILYKTILMIANALHWFNPVVYLMVRMANRDIEIVCDNAVVRNKDIEYRQEYCRTILIAAHKGFNPPLSTSFAVSKKVIKKRLEDILSQKLKKRGLVLFGAVAISVVAAGYMISFGQETIKKEIEEVQEVVVRTTPAPVAETAESVQMEAPVVTEKASTSTVTNTQTIASNVVSSSTPKPTETPIVTEAPQESSKAEWWNETVKNNMETYRKNRDISYVSKGDVKMVNADFESRESVTARDVFYVEPNETITVYHDGGVVQIADAITGELVHDSTKSDNDTVSSVTAGENGMYYMVNISQSEKNEERASVFVMDE